LPNNFGIGPGKAVIPSLVQVDFHLPFKIDGALSQVTTGVGIVFDAERGLILVDRFVLNVNISYKLTMISVILERYTLPTSMGDVMITFANSIVIPGRILYVHQIFNFGIVCYDVKLLGETFVKSAVFSTKDLIQGDSGTFTSLKS
jgi:hypothetical protein